MHEGKCVENAFAWPPHGNTYYITHEIIGLLRKIRGEKHKEEIK